MNKFGFIYKTTNLINGKIYIGQRVVKNKSIDNRYLGSGLTMLKAINKYGISNFKREIIEYCDTIEILNNREEFWISHFNSTYHKIGYNIRKGGNQSIHSEKTKKLISEKSKKRHKDPIFLNKISKINKEAQNRVEVRSKRLKENLSEETRKKISNGVREARKKINCSEIVKKTWINDTKRREELSLRNKARKSVLNLKKGQEIYISNREILTCDFCGLKTKSIGNIKRWHNQNCKNKNQEKIQSIEYLDIIPDYVYNLEIEDNHNYYVNGILTHNCDDPQNPKMAASEVERENVKNFWSNTLYSRLNQLELGVRIIVMQRLSEADLSGHLLETAPERHEHICIPVEIDLNNIEQENIKPKSLSKYYDQNGLFWPTRFKKSVIEDFISSLGSREAAGQLYQRPAPKEGNLVKREWFEIVNPVNISRDLRHHPVMFYIDTAETEKQEGDFSAICAAFKKDGIVYISNIVKVKKAFVDLCKFIQEWAGANMYSQYSMIKIEPKSSGKSVVASLRASTQLNVVEMNSPKDDKVTRLSAITPLIESGRVKLLQGNWIDAFLPNLLMFPNVKNDDDVDVFVHAVSDLLATNDFDFAFA